MASAPPGDPRRSASSWSDDPRYETASPDAPTHTPMRESTRRAATATVAMLIAAAIVVALIVLL